MSDKTWPFPNAQTVGDLYKMKHPYFDSHEEQTFGPVGDINSNEKGSGARYNQGKADLSLIPIATLEDEARVWMYGEAKYKRFNWMKGMPWSVPLACAMRHLAAWQSGEDLDPESGQPHLAHVMCNIRMLTLYTKTYPEGDDRPKEWL